MHFVYKNRTKEKQCQEQKVEKRQKTRHRFFSVARQTEKPLGRCRRGHSPSDFPSYPAAMPTGWVVDFACKINSLQIRTTSGWPNLLPRKSGENHFCDTLTPPVFSRWRGRLCNGSTELGEGEGMVIFAAIHTAGAKGRLL